MGVVLFEAMVSWIRNLFVYGLYGGACGRLKNKRNSEALEWIDPAIAWDPNGETNYLLQGCRGECLMRLKRYGDAVPVLRKTLDLIESETNSMASDPPVSVYFRAAKHLEYSEEQYNKSLNRTPETTMGFKNGSAGAG